MEGCCSGPAENAVERPTPTPAPAPAAAPPEAEHKLAALVGAGVSAVDAEQSSGSDASAAAKFVPDERVARLQADEEVRIKAEREAAAPPVETDFLPTQPSSGPTPHERSCVGPAPDAVEGDRIREQYLTRLRRRPCSADDTLLLAVLQRDIAKTADDPVIGRESAGAHRSSSADVEGVSRNADASEPSFPSAGVTVETMEAILRDERICSSTTTDEVCHTIIKPSTVPLGWVETVQPKSMSWGTMYVTAYKNLSTGERFPHPPAGTAALSDVLQAHGHTGIGKANVFFSHAWKFKFVDVVMTMRTFVDRERASGNEVEVYFWFDCCVVDEHASQAFPPEWWETAFANAVASIGHTCVMSTPWNAPLVITRAWCLWEIFCTLDAESVGCKLTLALPESEETAMLEAFAKDGEDAVLAPFAKIDSRLAEATNPDDLAKIQLAIERGPGHNALNSAVLQRSTTWVVNTIEQYIDGIRKTQAWTRHALNVLYELVELRFVLAQYRLALDECAEGILIATGQRVLVEDNGAESTDLSRVSTKSLMTGRLLQTDQQGILSADDEIVLKFKRALPQLGATAPQQMSLDGQIELLKEVIETSSRTLGPTA